MKWLKVEVTVSSEATEALSDAMLDLSPSGVQIDERGGSVVITMYPANYTSIEDFKATIENILTTIAAQGLDVQPGRIDITPITIEDWADNYKKFFKPIKIGSLLIKPSWEDVKAEPGEIMIQLDPGLAFGTGSHPTTEGCLIFLQEYVAGGEVVFDLGTGSGILAIAAAKLGAARVIAIDNDDVAIDVAKENAAINGVSDKIAFEVAYLAKISPIRVDILVANLTANLIVNLLPDIKQKLEALKVVIASGITAEQKDMVISALEENGFTIEKVLEKGEWVTIVSKSG